MIINMKQLIIALLFFSIGGLAAADVKDESESEREAEFSAMLKNATLKGSWIPVQQGATAAEKADSYHVLRAKKIADDKWHIVWKIKHQGKEIAYPIEVTVKWAGDSAVMILDEVKTGSGKRYSARILFHKDRYAGSWWGKDQPGGLLSGVITRPKSKN